jgi:ubiquinone/menaquinone biosynthesis C-methylase UbiE
MQYTTKPDGRTFSGTRHFDGVARHYRGLRDLDDRSARLVGQMVADLAPPGAQLRALDVGAGTGRYTEAVLAKVAADYGIGWTAVAYDANRMMLASPIIVPRDTEVQRVRVVGLAETLPFRDAAFDAVLSFNAVHHFDLNAFLTAAARALRPEGLLTIYTRTPEQNRQTVWGELFPHFADRETRLFPQEDLQRAVAGHAEFELVTVEAVPWTLRTTAARLVAQATGRYYSTFCFYTPEEIRAALTTFEAQLAEAYPDPSNVVWQNDHLLLVARRR